MTDLDKVLRRLGVLRGKPAQRRHLAFALGDDCREEHLLVLGQLAARRPGEDAGELIRGWLEDRSWRQLVVEEAMRVEQARLAKLTPSYVRMAAAARVLGDRHAPADVARDMDLSVDEVVQAAVDIALERGWSEQRIEVLLGLRAPAPLPRPAAPAPRPRIGSDADPQQAAARPTEDQLRRLYLDCGRRAPSHVIDALTRPPPK